MMTVPIRAVPAQVFDIVLGKQACTIKIYQKQYGLFLDLIAAGKPVITGVLCRDRSYIVRHEHLGFRGDMYFADSQGNSDPEHSGLGSRFVLIYQEEA